MKRERYEQRLFRILIRAGYSPAQILTISPEEMVEIPGITVPNIRTMLCLQNRILSKRSPVRRVRLAEILAREAEKRSRTDE